MVEAEGGGNKCDDKIGERFDGFDKGEGARIGWCQVRSSQIIATLSRGYRQIRAIRHENHAPGRGFIREDRRLTGVLPCPPVVAAGDAVA